ncbi:uncharacterized protein MELLADRAFT_104230 [Melampsora larici-populina 98AG31]|uniref:F-box domain-containing protein n=1 Tax=Melampsora larici-populina (strain 98AG31 / pathotype 3-4-7) TaxID=747676 RepID=F4RE09_MELLP|nr:uncharacterized protein MELLADRAFT_104230 [Melampsora larici-populina 98AG31]EGG09501.1 hypothetical protein MELLADRAFT_104230 [Melampsora larici-populina 98AG31]
MTDSSSCDSSKFKFRKLIETNHRKADSFGRRPLYEDVHFDDLALHVQQSLLGVKHDVVLRDSPGLCPKSLLKLLAQCDNLTKLCLRFPLCWRYPEVTNLSCNLTSLVSNLGHLQNLQYSGPQFSPIPAESIIEPLKHLPLLESLELSNILVRDWGRADCIASSLSTLKHLKHLVVNRVDIIDESWVRHKAPPQLAKLVIRHYPNAWLSNLPSYISSWAPYLTHLELEFVGHHQAEQILPTFNPKIHRFSLPDLTHLTIYRRCPNLRYLTVRDASRNGVPEFSEFIIRDVFPKLKELVMPMRIRCIDTLPDPRLDSMMNPLEDFCKSKGIEFKIFLDIVPNRRPSPSQISRRTPFEHLFTCPGLEKHINQNSNHIKMSSGFAMPLDHSSDIFQKCLKLV